MGRRSKRNENISRMQPPYMFSANIAAVVLLMNNGSERSMKTCASTSNGKDVDLILTAEGSGNRSAPCAVHIKTAVTALCPILKSQSGMQHSLLKTVFALSPIP